MLHDDKFKKMVGLAALAGATLPALGCIDSHHGDTTGFAADRISSPERQRSREARLYQIHDIGNGVYVFPNDPQFAETLSDFRAAHTDKKIISVSQGPDVTNGILENTDSRSNSFIVVTEDL